jgi:pentatricopeptide repeat protein
MEWGFQDPMIFNTHFGCTSQKPWICLQMYKMVRDAVWYKWDARLHARIVALLAKDGQSNAAMLQDLPEVQEFLSLAQRADLGCALIESYARCGLQSHALAAFQDLQSLPLARAVPFAYKTLIRAYCVLDLPSEAEQFLREMQVAGYQPSGDEYKSLLHGFGRNGMLREMEMLACEMCNQGVALDTAGFNMIISSYGQAGQHDKMVEVVDRMIAAGVEPNLVSWNALTKACPSLITAFSDGCGLLASPELLLLRWIFIKAKHYLHVNGC